MKLASTACLHITTLIIVAVSIAPWLNEQVLSIGLVNDNLTAIYHAHQIHADGIGQLIRINWARIPSLIPDYFIATAADQFGTTLAQKLTLSCLLQACLGISSIYLLLRASRSSPSNGLASIALASYGSLLFLSSGFRQLAVVASLPVNHGGNYITTSFFLAWLVFFLFSANKASSRVQVATAIFAILSTFSNRLFLLTALLPPLLICIAPIPQLRYRIEIPSLGPLIKNSMLGAMAGWLLYLVSPHQCSDSLVGTTNLNAIGNVIRANQGAIIFLLIPCLSWIAVRTLIAPCNIATKTQNSKILFLGDSLLLMVCCSVLAYGWISRGEPDAIYLRYILTPIMLAPLLLSFSIIHYLPKTFTHPSKLLKQVMTVSIISISAIAGINFSEAAELKYRPLNADRALLQAIPKMIKEHCDGPDCVILTSNPPFNALRINMELEHSGVKALEISGHGDPLIFWMSRSDHYKDKSFHKKDPSRALLSSRIIATNQQQISSLVSSLGKPIQSLPLDDPGTVLLIYSDSRSAHSKAVVFFKSQSQLPFCVPNSTRESLLRLRSLLQSIMKR